MHLIQSLSPATATGPGLGTGLNIAGAVPVPVTATNPTLGLKQAQEESHIRRNRGTREGDVGQLDEGFRTDVP